MIYDELAEEFEKRGYQWKIVGNKYITPDADDIERVVDAAIKSLYNDRDGSLREVGRLIIQKNEGHYDVYLHIGEVV